MMGMTTTLRKALPFVLLAMVVCWTFTSHQSPIHPRIAYAQTPPDCSFTYTFTGSGTQTGVSNLSGNTPCVNWRITFSTTGTLAATVTFQTSPDNSAWTSVPNTICSSTDQPPCILQGTNPLTGTSQGMSYFASYGNFVRLTVTTTGTGTGTARGYGAKGATADASIAGSGGGGVGPTGPTGPAGPTGATGPSGSSAPASSNLTPVTASANTTADQTLQEIALSAGVLNTLKAANIFHGSGRFTIAVAQTPTLTFKAKLCTVSGCGSGTVVTLATITSGATVAATSNGWNLQLMVGTSAIGATGNLWVHGAPGLTVDIGALPGSAATPYTDLNTAVSANIDLTAALFVDFTAATSTGNAGNLITQDIAEVLPQGAGGGGGGGGGTLGTAVWNGAGGVSGATVTGIISSITYGGAGIYTVNFTPAYTLPYTVSTNGACPFLAPGGCFTWYGSSPLTTTNFVLASANPGGFVDCNPCMATVFKAN